MIDQLTPSHTDIQKYTCLKKKKEKKYTCLPCGFMTITIPPQFDKQGYRRVTQLVIQQSEIAKARPTWGFPESRVQLV